MTVVLMVYANQNHSKEISNCKILKICASVFKIICTGASSDQNGLPHMKTPVKLNGIYVHNVWPFDRYINQNGLLVT